MESGKAEKVHLRHKWKHDILKLRQDNVLTTPNPEGYCTKTLEAQSVFTEAEEIMNINGTTSFWHVQSK